MEDQKNELKKMEKIEWEMIKLLEMQYNLIISDNNKIKNTNLMKLTTEEIVDIFLIFYFIFKIERKKQFPFIAEFDKLSNLPNEYEKNKEMIKNYIENNQNGLENLKLNLQLENKKLNFIYQFFYGILIENFKDKKQEINKIQINDEKYIKYEEIYFNELSIHPNNCMNWYALSLFYLQFFYQEIESPSNELSNYQSIMQKLIEKIERCLIQSTNESLHYKNHNKLKNSKQFHQILSKTLKTRGIFYYILSQQSKFSKNHPERVKLYEKSRDCFQRIIELNESSNTAAITSLPAVHGSSSSSHSTSSVSPSSSSSSSSLSYDDWLYLGKTIEKLTPIHSDPSIFLDKYFKSWQLIKSQKDCSEPFYRLHASRLKLILSFLHLLLLPSSPSPPDPSSSPPDINFFSMVSFYFPSPYLSIYLPPLSPIPSPFPFPPPFYPTLLPLPPLLLPSPSQFPIIIPPPSLSSSFALLSFSRYSPFFLSFPPSLPPILLCPSIPLSSYPFFLFL